MKKCLECPCCQSRIIDESRKTVSKLKIIDDVTEDEADYYLKCKKCKKQIGITKIS